MVFPASKHQILHFSYHFLLNSSGDYLRAALKVNLEQILRHPRSLSMKLLIHRISWTDILFLRSSLNQVTFEHLHFSNSRKVLKVNMEKIGPSSEHPYRWVFRPHILFLVMIPASSQHLLHFSKRRVLPSYNSPQFS